MDTTLICIGGGELKDRTTLKIDEYIAAKAKARAGERRANALFLPTASHDFMPYYNTFHKVYTGLFDIKTDVALCAYREADMTRMQEKFEKADMIYVGGGDTVFMMNRWKETGILPLIEDAYKRGVILCGLSAGAICWFSDIYTDSASCGNGEKYAMYKGLGWIKGKISPHYGARMVDFDKILCYNNGSAYGLEDNSALVLVNGEALGAISSGGTVWKILSENGVLKKERVPLLQE